MARFTTSDGISLYFEDAGQGLPVLCLAGLTRDGRDFDYAAPALTNVRMIRLDHRGRGRSEWAKDPMSYNVGREAQDAVELLDHLGIKAAAVLGVSRGGLIAMTLAATVPDRLLGSCLVDVGPEINVAGLLPILDYLGRRPAWKTLEEATKGLATRLAGFEGVSHARWAREAEKLFLPDDKGLNITYDPALRDAVVAAFNPDDLPDLWPFFMGLTCKPLAVVRGGNSDLLSAEGLAAMQEKAPHAHVAVVPDRGHAPFLDEAEAVAVLKSWIEELGT